MNSTTNIKDQGSYGEKYYNKNIEISFTGKPGLDYSKQNVETESNYAKYKKQQHMEKNKSFNFKKYDNLDISRPGQIQGDKGKKVSIDKSYDYNKFKFEAYFLNVANFDTFQPSGMLVITTYVNGQKYQRKIKVKADIMKQVRSLNGQYRYCDINYDLQRYIYFQLCLLVTSILLNDNKPLIELLETVSKYGCSKFDYKTLEDIVE